MPGLDKWIMMENKSVGATEGLVLGLGGKLLSGIAGNRLKREMDYAFQRLFPGMLVGPGDSVVTVKR